jgi:hypothetical protein
LLALLAASILAATLAACGDSAKTTTSTNDKARAGTTAPTRTITLKDSSGGYLNYDGDTDPDDESGSKPSAQNDDQHLLKEYGVKPSATEMQAIATSVKSYFAASAQENGARACSLIAKSLATGLATSSGTSGNTACAKAMTTILAQEHAQLAADEVATMTVITARVKNSLALAVFGFRQQPEREILLQHEGRTWRIDALTPSQLP